MKYFTLNEFIKSDTATRLGIDNTPTEYQKANVKELVENLLDPLREDWAIYCRANALGTPAIRVGSGIRSKKLNEAVGGSKTSAHYHGWAADLVPLNGRLDHFKKFCFDWLQDKDFDQMISEDENSRGIPSWLHIGYKRGNGDQRRQFLYMKNGKYYYLPELLDGSYM